MESDIVERIVLNGGSKEVLAAVARKDFLFYDGPATWGTPDASGKNNAGKPFWLPNSENDFHELAKSSGS